MNTLIGAVLQVAAFTLIPFVVYLIRTKSSKGFFRYIGLVRSNRRANGLAIIACLIFVAPILALLQASPEFQEIMFNPKSVTGGLRAMGFGGESVFILLSTALIKTSLSEEIFFRGFLAKRLIAAAGYQRGNIFQAAIFGIIHTALFAFITTNILFLVVIFVVPAVGAYVSASINEKVAGGSIVPGWISHALANVLSYSIVGFLM